jgi:general stress protein 26
MSPNAPSPAHVWRAIQRRSFCTLATSSATGEPHVAGVLYAVADRVLYLTTQTHAKKARNLGDNARVAVCIPVRTYPVGPPFCVQFRGTAELLSPQHPDITTLLHTRRLKKITSHGELDDPDSCFVRIVPGRRISTYGIGVPLRTLLRDPIHGSRTVDMGTAR